MTHGGINLADGGAVDFRRLPKVGGAALERWRRAQELIGQSAVYWRDAGLLQRSSTGGFAVVVKFIGDSDLSQMLDNPSELFDAVYMHGHGVRYAANALRKMRATARTGVDSIVLAQSVDEMFMNRVGDDDTDDFIPWGEFPYGGAVVVGEGDERTVVSVSGFTPEQDHWLAKTVGGFMLLPETA